MKSNLRNFLFSVSVSIVGTANTLQSAAPAPTESKDVVFQIDKMMCGGCTSRVKQVIQNEPGTSDISVRLEDHKAAFKCTKTAKTECKTDEIIKKLKKIGYPPKVISGA